MFNQPGLAVLTAGTDTPAAYQADGSHGRLQQLPIIFHGVYNSVVTITLSFSAMDYRYAGLSIQKLAVAWHMPSKPAT